MKINENTFICLLSQEIQIAILEKCTIYLENEGYDTKKIEEILDNVSSSRLWVVGEILDISKYLT